MTDQLPAPRRARSARPRATRRAGAAAPPNGSPTEDSPPPDPAGLAERLAGLIPCTAASECPTGPTLWLVPGFVPDRSITLIEGRKGAGKSLVMASWAARVALGGARLGRHVLWSTLEENLGTQTRPRLEAAGCCLDLVTFPGNPSGSQVIERPLCFPADFLMLRRLCGVFRPRLLVLDPLSSHVSTAINLNNEQQARSVMDPLTEIAGEFSLVVIASRHLRKGAGLAIDAGLGSVALAASARSVVCVRQVAEDALERVLVSVACNLGPTPRPQAFRIQPSNNGSALAVWGKELDLNDPALSPKPPDEADRDALADAKAFLCAELHDEDLPAETVQGRALKATISPATLRRAKQQLGVKSYCEGARDSRIWYWHLPRKPPPQGGLDE